MVSPRIEDAVPEPIDGSAVVTTSRFRSRDRWRSMNSPADILRYLALPSAAAASQTRVLLVAARRDIRRLIDRLANGPWNGPRIVGFIAAGHGRFSGPRPLNRHIALHPQTNPVPVLGSIDRLSELVNRVRATHVVVAVSGNSGLRNERPPVTQVINSDVIVQWILVDSGRLDLGSLTTSSPSTTWTLHPVGSAGIRYGNSRSGTGSPGRVRPNGRRTSLLPSCPFFAHSRCLLWSPSHLSDLRSTHFLHSRSGRTGGAAVSDHQVSKHEVRCRAGDRTDLGLRSRQTVHEDRRLASALQHRRVTATLERAARRHESGRASAGTP